MTLIPSDSPAVSPSADEDVQHVVAVRAESADPVAALGERTASVLGIGARTFFGTIKPMLLLAAILGLAAAWWAERGSVIRGVFAAGIVFVPAAAVAILLAGQRAAAAVAVETWRQTGLARQILSLLIDRMQTDSGGGTTDPEAGLPTQRLSLAEALVRLKRNVKEWSKPPSADRPSVRLIIRSQRLVSALIDSAMTKELEKQAAAGPIDLSVTREKMAATIDDYIAERMRLRMLVSLAGAVLAVLAWAVAVAWTLGRLAE